MSSGLLFSFHEREGLDEAGTEEIMKEMNSLGKGCDKLISKYYKSKKMWCKKRFTIFPVGSLFPKFGP